jgi:hypothetical protein
MRRRSGGRMTACTSTPGRRGHSADIAWLGSAAMIENDLAACCAPASTVTSSQVEYENPPAATVTNSKAMLMLTVKSRM